MTTGMKKTLAMGFDEALVRVPEALKAEGFGVLTEIDVQRTLEQKLGVTFRRYKILGACNPPFAHQALRLDLEAGLMMPCNVLMYEQDDGAVCVVAVDPEQTVRAIGNEQLALLAATIKHKLQRVLSQLP